jgi:hypothetical protein
VLQQSDAIALSDGIGLTHNKNVYLHKTINFIHKLFKLELNITKKV